MARKKTTANARDKQLADAVERVRRTLGIETFDTRGRDHLDFHEVSVRVLREAIQAAFMAGYDAGVADGKRLSR